MVSRALLRRDNLCQSMLAYIARVIPHGWSMLEPELLSLAQERVWAGWPLPIYTG